MIRRVANALQLFLRVQLRSLFPHIYLGLAVLTIAGFRWLLPEDLRAWLLPAFLLAEPGVLGLTVVAAQRYMEKSERNESVLAVTPLRGSEYVIALVLATTLQATLAGALIQAGVIGLDERVVLLLPLLFLTAAIAGFVSLALSTYAAEFTRFIVSGLVLSTIVAQLPLLSYFGFAPRAAFAWSPGDAAVFGFALLSAQAFDPARYALSLVVLTGFASLAFAWALACYRTRIRARLGQA